MEADAGQPDEQGGMEGLPEQDEMLEVDSDEWGDEEEDGFFEDADDLDGWDLHDGMMLADEEEEVAVDFTDDDEDDDAMFMDFDAHPELPLAERIRLECGALQHDAEFVAADRVTRHKHVRSSVTHHQTADALAFLPRPAGGAGSGASSSSGSGGSGGATSSGVEEVIVSNEGRLSIFQLAPGQRAKLLAHATTCFKHYSIAASPCGAFVAVSGNSGVVTLFRVVRQPAPAPADGAAAPRHAPAPAASPAGGSGAGSDGDADADAGPLEWQLLHEATLLCVVRETMVNAVRFGLFSGRMRLLVAHQEGLLFLFNLPPDSSSRGSAGTGTSSIAAADAGGASAGTAAAAAAATAAAALMVHDLPGWQPCVHSINAQYARQLLAHLDQLQQQLGMGTVREDGKQEQQQEQEQQMEDAEQEQQQAEQEQAWQHISDLVQLLQRMGWSQEQSSGETEAASATITQQACGGCSLAPAAAASAPGSSGQQAVQPETAAEPGEAEPGAAGADAPAAEDAAAPSVAAAPDALQAAVDCLLLALLELERKQPALAQTVAALGGGLSSSCEAGRARAAAELLQRARLYDGVQALLRARQQQGQAELASWLDELRRNALQAEQLLGLRGVQHQQQQWQQLAARRARGAPAELAARAVLQLLLVRLLEPPLLPVMKQDARVAVLRAGPQVDTARRFEAGEAAAAPRLATCAIGGLAGLRGGRGGDADADADAAMAEQLAAEGHEGAAAVAADDALEARQLRRLPLNICEASPDGRWLAVGMDSSSVALVPAAPGYQMQPCRQLCICPSAQRSVPRWFLDANPIGIQYLAFNASSSLLATSCDSLKLVSVLSVPRGHLVATFTMHAEAPLPLRWLPPPAPCAGGEAAAQQGWGDSVLAWAERRRRLHLADVSTFWPSQQSPRRGRSSSTSDHFCIHSCWEPGMVPETPPPAAVAAAAAATEASGSQVFPEDVMAMVWRPPESINGLAVTPGGRLLVAGRVALFEQTVLQAWSQQHHTRFPAAYRRAARLLLMGAAAAPSAAGDGSGEAGARLLPQLPHAVLERVLAAAATPQTTWARMHVPSQGDLARTAELLKDMPTSDYGWEL